MAVKKGGPTKYRYGDISVIVRREDHGSHGKSDGWSGSGRAGGGID
jgi:hypothetical protein